MALLFNPFVIFIFVTAVAVIQGFRLIWKREVTRTILEDKKLVTITYRGRIPVVMGLRLIFCIIFIFGGILVTFLTNNPIWNSTGFIVAFAFALFIEYLIRQWRNADRED